MNIWGDKEVTDFTGQLSTEKQFAEMLKVQFTPSLLFLNETGQTVLRLNGYIPIPKFSIALDYVSQKQETRLHIAELARQASPPPTWRVNYMNLLTV